MMGPGNKRSAKMQRRGSVSLRPSARRVSESPRACLSPAPNGSGETKPSDTVVLINVRFRGGTDIAACLGKSFLHICSSIGRCARVFGLFARHTWPLAIMPCADRVPNESPHSTMREGKWVVLIARSTGSALRAVRPPNCHITPKVRRKRLTQRARWVLCSTHP